MTSQEGELLYNGIRLPTRWPPADQDPDSREPASVPYLESPPEVIPIDVGRQLFVDDFLIDQTNLERRYHLAQKYEGNPILVPETDLEMNGGYRPVAVPFSDGVFFDPVDRLFKMWYHAGWYDTTAYATSTDGLHWERPDLDVVAGTNCVIPPRPDLVRDGSTAWIDHDTEDPEERFKMLLYGRTESRGGGSGGRLYTALPRLARDPAQSKGYGPCSRGFTSPDGIHWKEQAQAGPGGDNSTCFYNPFRKRWVFSIRNHSKRGRTRGYWEHSDFLEGCRWPEGGPVFWAGADDLDLPDPDIGDDTQLYKIDAVAYESIMLGLILIHRGPDNALCLSGGFPKVTELTVAYSRDGFHWHRPDRRAFIGATRQESDWDRAYIHSVGGVCLVVGDTLCFYYAGWSGRSPEMIADTYADGSTGIANLRRDGFASMETGQQEGFLTSRKVTFSGKHLFVNANTSGGQLRAEILDENGQTIAPFSRENCSPLSADKTCQIITWKDRDDLSSLAGKSVRLKFYLTEGSLYSFWISPERSGASHGYVAAGGPRYCGPKDTVGATRTQ